MSYRAGLVHGAFFLLAGEGFGWLVLEWIKWATAIVKMGGY